MSRIEDQANYYKNLHLRDRSIIAAIHVEDKDDENFWNIQLQHAMPGKYHFISHSKNDNGNAASGCTQCLRYRPYINRDFFICIDSDLRLLRQEEGLDAESHIAQTHTYSWENHFCESHCLQRRFIERINDSNFDFISFLDAFSKIVYKPLLLLVHHKTPELNKIWNVSKFNACIPLQPTRADLADNGQVYLEKTAQLFEKAIRSLELPEGFTIKGLTPENSYLHIQGHQLYKLLLHIGTILTKGREVAFRSEILDTARQTSGYDEINDVQSDLSTILSNR